MVESHNVSIEDRAEWLRPSRDARSHVGDGQQRTTAHCKADGRVLAISAENRLGIRASVSTAIDI
ncbi:MAG: hypothetical protein GEU86_10810 [Actinophytocola sp.]|nr:hypothetical protein [Actinophytocola sp.]